MLLRVLSAGVLAALAAAAESPTVLFQRAVYLEETAGDLDGAVGVYRQILSAGAGARTYEAAAQIHLASCLAKIARRAAGSAAGTHYKDAEVGYSFDLPFGWIIRVRDPYNRGPGNCAELRDPENRALITICAKPANTAENAINTRLVQGAEATIQELRGHYSDLTLFPGSPQLGRLGGQRTVTVFAKYTPFSQFPPAAKVEWATWVQTTRTRASVVIVVPAAGLDAFRARFTPILESFRLP